MTVLVLGCDPGPTTGMCLAGTAGGVPLAFQCNAPAAYPLACFLVEANDGPATIILAGERFVPGRGAAPRGAGSSVTRALIADLDGLGSWRWRSAADVKPWATNERLKAAGLLDACHGMPHALDACRHAAYCGVHDLGWPDPLSREGRSFWRAQR